MGKGDRRGRPRKAGPRYPGGKLVPAAVVDAQEQRGFAQSPVQTVLQARRRHLTGVHSADPVSKAEADRLQLRLRGSVLGHMLADGHLTADQAAAAETFGQIRARYRSLMGLPPETPQSAAYGLQRGGGTQHSQEALDAATRALRAAERALLLRDVAVLQALIRVAGRDERAPVHLVVAGCQVLIEEKAV